MQLDLICMDQMVIIIIMLILNQEENIYNMKLIVKTVKEMIDTEEIEEDFLLVLLLYLLMPWIEIDLPDHLFYLMTELLLVDFLMKIVIENN